MCASTSTRNARGSERNGRCSNSQEIDLKVAASSSSIAMHRRADGADGCNYDSRNDSPDSTTRKKLDGSTPRHATDALSEIETLLGEKLSGRRHRDQIRPTHSAAATQKRRRSLALWLPITLALLFSARNLLRPMMRLHHTSVSRYQQDFAWAPQLEKEKKKNGKRYSYSARNIGATNAKGRPEGRTEICHVTSNFGAGIDKTDWMLNIPRELRSPPFRHILFTNLPDMDSKGREVILLPDKHTSHLNYRRMITWSRWPKFVGWRHPALASCKYIAYSDAVAAPRGSCDLACWERLGALSRNATHAPGGVIQDLRPERLQWTVTRELKRLVHNKKDVGKPPSYIELFPCVWLSFRLYLPI